jgi:hypothetical protein
MGNPFSTYTCVNCGKSEAEVPILKMRFQEAEIMLCSSCFPILLHRPDQLVGRLKGAEVIKPVSHSHD